MKTQSFLSDFQVCLPRYSLPQAEILRWIQAAHAESGTATSDFPLARFIERYAVKESLIERRHFECDDLFSSDWKNNLVYPVSAERPQGACIDRRTDFYLKRAEEVLAKLYPANAEAPGHMVHVTCTGYVSPSPVQKLVASRSWESTVTHAYHMGCYASLPAIRLAQGLQQVSGKSADVVHTEMCGLHMNPSDHAPEQVVVQTLFADGHIKYQVSDKTEQGYAIRSIRERVVPGTSQDMSWAPASWGMQMTLSKDVPSKLRSVIREFYWQLVQDAGEDPAQLLREAHFAIHPGGPKIIDAVQTELELSDEQTHFSRKVLRERGNMSSATLPHVWNELLPAAKDKDWVVSFAFGPGLTIFGSLFQVVKR